MYESHDDGSGVMYSSRLRPVLNLKPGADGWAYSADTNLVAFLDTGRHDHDVVTDDDLHHEGRRAARPLPSGHDRQPSRVLVDVDARRARGVAQQGGRLLYLGGNGFYWRVSWSRHEPHVMEVRRAEDGTRGWIAEARASTTTRQAVSTGACGGGWAGAQPARRDRLRRPGLRPGGALRAQRGQLRQPGGMDLRGRRGRRHRRLRRRRRRCRPGDRPLRPVPRVPAPRRRAGLLHRVTAPRCCAPRRSSAAPPSRPRTSGPTSCSSRRRTVARCSRWARSPGTARWPHRLRQRHRPHHRPTCCTASSTRRRSLRPGTM